MWYQYHVMTTTIRDVATDAGVSPMTVSRVVNEHPNVSDTTRRHVLASVRKLGYVPNRLASGLAKQKTGTIAVIVTDVANPFFTLVVRGAEEMAWHSGYNVILCDTQGDLERERSYIEAMISLHVEGALISPVSDRSRPTLLLLRRNGVPFVLIDRSVEGLKADLVEGDSVDGAFRLVQHLTDLGHTRIGMITESAEMSNSRDRLAGYSQALELAGITFDPMLVALSDALDPDHARDATLQLLALADPPTAIFAINNIAVIGVAEAAREKGLAIPDDLAIVCFDDIEFVSRLYPFLTVMAQPAVMFGTVGTQLLLDRILGRRVGDRPRRVVLPPEFIVRRSSGAPSSE
jgi:LacI family transcriptional regulator